MPNNWKTYKLGDFAQLRKESIKPSEFNGEKYIGLEHIGQGSFLLDGIGDASDVTSNKSKFKSGDILYGKIRPYFKKVYRPKFSGICSTDMLIIKSRNEEIVTQNYLHQIIKTQDFTDKATETSTGTKMPRADWKSLQKVDFQIPPLPEQKAIANILSAIDDKIENNLVINKTLEDMAMALYKHWFVDFGPFQEGEFIDSQLGPIPRGWEVKSIYDLATYVNGAAFKSSDFKEDGLYVIKIAELKNGITDNTKKSNKKIKSELVLENGSVLFSWSASLDVFLWSKGKALLNQHIFNVLPNKSLPIEILYFLLRDVINHFQYIAASRATTMGHIKISHLKETMIAVPSLSNQKEILELFGPIYNQILENKVENETLTQLRDTLLPKLISGEVRLKEFKEQVEKVI